MRSEAALEAVRFDAQRAGDADVVRMADTQISSEEKSINSISEIEKQEGRIDAVVDGTFEELLAVEKLVGSMKTLKANAAEDELRTSNLIATARRKLLAASLAAPQSLPPALNT